MTHLALALSVHVTVLAGGPSTMPAFSIDADYPGGNIVIERIDGNDVHLQPDLRDTKGWWFYWNFRVRRAGGRTLRFHFAGRDPIGTRGPAVSTDGGRTWAYLGRKVVRKRKGGVWFDYAFPAGGKAARFAFGIPYLQADLDRWLKRHRGSEHLAVRELCRTRAGRTARRLHVGRLTDRPDARVLLTARHHACESLAGYVLEGALEAVLADTDDGRWLREHAEILAVPFVDKDGVEAGDQGKNRKPRDHNRDYIGKSVHPTTAAVRKLIPKWSGGRLRVAIDLHCPHIRGANNERIYLVGSPDSAIAAEQVAFAKVLARGARGRLEFKPDDLLPFGTAWNKHSSYSAGKSFARWAGGLKGVRMATTIEFPYANIRRQTVTADAARAFGADLTAALRAYLDPDKPNGG